MGEEIMWRKGRIRRIFFLSCVILFALLLFFQESYSKEKSKLNPNPTIEIQTKEVIGEIISLTPLKNPKLIGIAYEKEGVGEDIFFEIDKNVKVVHKKNLDEIKLGDLVAITYEERIQVNKEGKEEVKKIAKIIRFVKTPINKLRVMPEEKKKAPLEIKGLRSAGE
jgi:uncharacterized protein YuzE